MNQKARLTLTVLAALSFATASATAYEIFDDGSGGRYTALDRVLTLEEEMRDLRREAVAHHRLLHGRLLDRQDGSLLEQEMRDLRAALRAEQTRRAVAGVVEFGQAFDSLTD